MARGYRGRRPPRRVGRHRTRRADGGDGAVRLGQVDADAHSGRARQADGGLGRDRRHRDHDPGRQRADEAAPAAHRLRLPVLQPAADAQRRGEHRAAAGDRRREARAGAGSRRSSSRWVSGTASRTGRPSCRAASSSAWRLRARSSPGRPWSSPTSRPATSTRRRAGRSSSSCATRSRSSVRRS